MMELTPLDVRKKKDDFKRAVRGYEPAQVESFLEMCAERLDQLVQREKRLEGEVAGLRERLAAFQERERALNEALVSAQELREEARSQAERGAELKLREAEQEAAAIRQRAESATEASRQALEDLKVRRSGFLRSLRWSLERFLGEIEEEERRVAAEEGGVLSAEPVLAPGAGVNSEGEADGQTDADDDADEESLDGEAHDGADEPEAAEQRGAGT
jgi:DivIVA domain-containing protein